LFYSQASLRFFAGAGTTPVQAAAIV